MDCSKTIELLAEYLEGTVTPDLKEHLRRHLADCPPCQHFVDSYRKTSELCRGTLLKQAPRELTDRLKAFLRSKCQPKS